VQQPPEAGKALVEFFTWVTHDGQKFAKDLNYAPLPADLVRRVDERLRLVQWIR
jgi:phosphate transport system substrate-binding protein